MVSIRPALAALRLSTPSRQPLPRALHPGLHTSATRCATPLPHPSIPGPPPATPTPAASDALERVARKRRQAELLSQAREVRNAPSKSKRILQKRFWKDVSVTETEDGLQVFLDARPVRTPAKDILTLPSSKPQLATAIALEWDLLLSAQQALKTHLIPMTSLASRAVDIEIEDADGESRVRENIISMMMRYLATDTLLCWAPEKVLHETPQNGFTLRETQIKIATPIIAYLNTHVWPGVEIKPILEPDSIMPVPQPDMTQTVIRGWLTGLPAFELAGLERAVLASKSLLVGVRLVHEWSEAFAHERKSTDAGRRFGIEDAAEAASLEVRWQTHQWGEVDDTHDVEKEDMRRQLGSAILLVSGEAA
ncbi:ATP synthase mitochondrial F1 complex assembly factor 2 [Massarina eburnea CBS 473.64]|uniref:ATP synthase mitochondrial F1 complex assembly factor 2 n=1 Tax=Massarina eburnea CBS 473.64 TaxID=1395130 RepID=A0A6A6S2V1_9PLEO|nr:ATP synthase mitochondrial F1 complex assembly factor 2 [Massarina eburnea CBS 473.64]